VNAEQFLSKQADALAHYIAALLSSLRSQTGALSANEKRHLENAWKDFEIGKGSSARPSVAEPLIQRE
jgi:hypothetical protein